MAPRREHPDARRAPYLLALRNTLRCELERDPHLFVIGEDVALSGGAFGVTAGLSDAFDGASAATGTQRRVIDAPLAEAGFTGLALGACVAGLRAVVEFQYADFASEAFKMIVNYAASHRRRGLGALPVVFRCPSGWTPGAGPFHSVNPESWFGSTPGLKIVAAVAPGDASALLSAAIRDPDPVVFLEYRACYRLPVDVWPPVLRHVQDDSTLGRARVVSLGGQLTIVSWGTQLLRVIEAADLVRQRHSRSVEVIDLRTLVPWDAETVARSVRKTSRLLVTWEGPLTGAFGHTVATRMAEECFEYLDAPVRVLAAADTPVPYAPALELAHLPTTEKLVTAIESLLAY